MKDTPLLKLYFIRQLYVWLVWLVWLYVIGSLLLFCNASSGWWLADVRAAAADARAAHSHTSQHTRHTQPLTAPQGSVVGSSLQARTPKKGPEFRSNQKPCITAACWLMHPATPPRIATINGEERMHGVDIVAQKLHS